jgi:hypothetical protein
MSPASTLYCDNTCTDIATIFISRRKETFLNRQLFKYVIIDVTLAQAWQKEGDNNLNIRRHQEGGTATIEMYNDYQEWVEICGT